MNNKVSIFQSDVSLNEKHIVVALGKSTSKLPIGLILSSSDGRQWTIIDNDLKFQSSLNKLIAEKEVEGIFFYDLNGIGHMEKPIVGQDLLY